MAQHCSACHTRVRLRRPDLAVRCRCSAIVREPSPPCALLFAVEPMPTRAAGAALAAAGAYDPPPGVRYELDAWELVSSTVT